MVGLEAMLAEAFPNSVFKFNHIIVELNEGGKCVLEGCFHMLGLREYGLEH